jgi:hypothetical protein
MLTLGYELGYNLKSYLFAVHVLLFSQANKIKGCAYHMVDIAAVEDFGLVGN